MKNIWESLAKNNYQTNVKETLIGVQANVALLRLWAK